MAITREIKNYIFKIIKIKSKMREKSVFSVGMEVWDMTSLEKGVVKDIKSECDYPVVVYFGNLIQYYTFDGRHEINQPKVLFTKKYDLVNSRFTQEPPKPVMKGWNTVFVWDQFSRDIRHSEGTIDFISDEYTVTEGHRRNNTSVLSPSPGSREERAIELLREVIYAGVKLPSISKKVKSFIEQIDNSYEQ